MWKCISLVSAAAVCVISFALLLCTLEFFACHGIKEDKIKCKHRYKLLTLTVWLFKPPFSKQDYDKHTHMNTKKKKTYTHLHSVLYTNTTNV